MRIIQLVALVSLQTLASSHIQRPDCHGLEEEETRIQCQQWTNQTVIEDGHTRVYTPKQRAFLKSLQGDKRRQKRQISKPAARKEYRSLTEIERKRLHFAMNIVKKKAIDGVSKWDLLTSKHYPDTAPGAHFGPAFLPWHREFLRQVEVALRAEDDTVALPYWDTRLDSDLPDPRHSMLWSDLLLGNGNGHVVSGPFAHWPMPVPLPKAPHVRALYRQLGASRVSRLMSHQDFNWMQSLSNYSQLTYCKDKRFETMHGLSHLWVGGYMHTIRISPNDPAFYMLHSYVDFMWEQFRQKQSPIEREHGYLSIFEMCNWPHALHAEMKPFDLYNEDGLSERYTKDWYNYEAPPTCSFERPSCGSAYLFCDTRGFVCRSKIQPGGNCTGFEGQAICYNSSCIGGTCLGRLTYYHSIVNTEQTSAMGVWFKVLVLGTAGAPVTDYETDIVVEGLSYRGLEISHPPSNYRFPEHPGIAYVRVLRPIYDPVRARVQVRDRFGRICQAFCFNGTAYQSCNGNITLSADPAESDSIAYSHSLGAMPFLNSDLRGHPTNWKVAAPFLGFLCDFENNVRYFAEATKNVAPQFTLHKHVYIPVIVLDKHMPYQKSVTNVTVTAVSNGKRFETKLDAARHSGMVFVRAPNPFLSFGRVDVQIDVRSGNKLCEHECTRGYCSSTVTLNRYSNDAAVNSFLFDQSMEEFLGWSMIGHPRLWKPQAVEMSFRC